MTAEQIVEAALSECEALGHKFWTAARGPLYRHITVRQQELFSAAAAWNEEWAGWSLASDMTDGAADFSAVLTDSHPEAPGMEKVTRIEIVDPGDSGYAAGTEINVVGINDGSYSALPPRATFRSGVLRGWGDDLDGVAKVELFYVRIPRPVEAENDPVELVGAHVDLLILDLARHLILATHGEKDGEHAAALQQINDREQKALAKFEAYVRAFSPLQTRFTV